MMAERRLHGAVRLALLAALLILAGWVLGEPFGSRLSAQYTVNWHQTGGPSGGRTNVLLVDPQNPSVIYAGTDGGMFSSRDGGATWERTSSGLLGEQSVRALALDPQASPERTLYAGTFSGVYRSTDNGQTWSQANVGLTRKLVFALAIDAASPSTVYAGTDTQLFKSVNGGDSWEAIQEGLPAEGVWSLIVHPVTPKVLYAGMNSGVYKSTNGGMHWYRASDGMPDVVRINALVMDPQHPTVLHAATDSGVYRTIDGADSWQPAVEGTGSTMIHALAIDPNRPDNLIAAVGTQGIRRTTDSGHSWEPTIGTLDELVSCLAIHPLNSQVIWAGTGRGVYYSNTAGESWESRNVGLISTAVYVLAGDPANPGRLYASTTLDVHKTVDDGNTWFPINSGFVRPRVYALAVDPRSTDTLYAGTWTSEVYRSIDGGVNWVQVNGGLARNATITSMVMHYEPDMQGDRPSSALFAGTNGAGVYRSTDGGIEWTPMNSGLDDLRVQVLALAPEQGGMLYAGTGTGISRLDLPGGLVWQAAEEGLPQDEVSSIAIDPSTPTTVYAATAAGIGKLFRSTDGGKTWAAIGQGSLPTNARIQALAFHRQQAGPSLLYAGTDGGVFYSDDGGFGWQAINDGLPQPAKVLALWVDGQRSRLYASISNRGVYYSVVTPVSRFAWSPLTVAILGSVALAAMLLVGRWVHYSSESVQQRLLDDNWRILKPRIRTILYRQSQVTLDALQELPTGVRLRALQRYVQEQRDEDLMLRVDPPMLLPANAEQVGDLMRDWEAAQKRRHDPSAFRAVVARLANQLCQLLGFTLVDSRSYKNLHGYVIRAPALRLNMPPTFPVIFLQKRNLVEEDIRSLDDLMAILNVPSYLALLVVPDDDEAAVRGPALKTRFAKLRHSSAHDYILLEYEDLYSIFVAKDAEKRFISIMLEQVDLTVVSPYVTSGPVPENMFFGREYELKTITRTIKDESFAVTGTRKIGKTSILAKLHRTFSALPEFHPLYLDCQAVQDYEDFYDTAETVWQVLWSPRTPEHLVQLVSMLKGGRNEQLLVFLMDEVDALLQHDQRNQERLFRVCRALSQEGQCRFVFCGGRFLHTQQHNPDSALFNFCQTIHLSYLKPRDTARIVAEPMQEMGIAFEEPNTLIQRIVDLSACHPNLVQYICHELIVKINARGERLIRLSDLDDIEGSAEFGAYFAEVMWVNTTALERLITLLMLDQSSISMPQIQAALRQHGLDIAPADIERALQGLVFCSILSKDGQSYSFATPAFPSIVAVTQDVTALIERTLQEVASPTGVEA